MQLQLHKNARTTPAVRAEIKRSNLSERQRAERFNSLVGALGDSIKQTYPV